MSKLKKKQPKNHEKAKVIRLDHYRKQVEELKEKGHDSYAPKIGRQIHQIEKKIKKIA